MKLLDRTIGLSKPVKELADAVKQLVLSVHDMSQKVEDLVKNVGVLLRNQSIHYRMITHLHLVQQGIMRRMSEGGIDTSFPDIDAPKNREKRAATKKPN